VLRGIDAFTKMQVKCQKLLSLIPCSDLLPTYRECLKKLRTIHCSYGWTNYFYVFISLGERQRRFPFCATSDKWNLIRQCDRTVKFRLFFFVSKITSCRFSLRIFVYSVCCVLCVTTDVCRCLNEVTVLLHPYLCCVFLNKLRVF
jgi:hypothetical protein